MNTCVFGTCRAPAVTAIVAGLVLSVLASGVAAQELSPDHPVMPELVSPEIPSLPPAAGQAPDVPAVQTDAGNPAEVVDDTQTPEMSLATEPAGSTSEASTFLSSATGNTMTFLRDGGTLIWAISVLSVVTLTLILWKTWRLAMVGAWSKGAARRAVALYQDGNPAEAFGHVAGRRGLRSKVVGAAIGARRDLADDDARAETGRVAKMELAEASTGLRALELIATIAPLLGLLGTVLGMIAAFQALQQAGSRADPALLAGGIWEALLTTAAGMAVAIPASAALSWFEAVIDRMRRDVEDAATRIFITPPPRTLPRGRPELAAAAE